MRAERLWQLALARSQEALAGGALVPLATEVVERPGLAPFQLRRLLSRTPKHLRAAAPKPNPFLPWETALEVARPRPGHVLLLNKYPVQPAHLLLITDHWAPQAGWLTDDDWAAVAAVARDTGGLWFFNSCAAAGASQPHRHLQLLPRAAASASCPMAAEFAGMLADASDCGASLRFPWAFRLSRRRDPGGHGDLAALYRAQLAALLDANDLPQLVEYNTQVYTYAGVSTRVIPVNKMIYLPANPASLGNTFWGITAEALELVGMNNPQLTFSQAPGLVGTVTRSGDPVRTWTHVAAIGMPVLAAPERLLTATLW